MKVLVAGGTSFVGRAIAQCAFEGGHEVTVVNRGLTMHDLPRAIECLVGDRRGDLSALHHRSFDATVDTIAYRPRDVTALAQALGDRAGHILHISSVSAYAPVAHPGAVETELSLAPGEGLDIDGPITSESYGPLKAASERAFHNDFSQNPRTVIRPTYVIGSHDATLRFPYWVARLRRGGDVAVPNPSTNPLQYIDARDLAEFCVRCIDNQTVGDFHVAGPDTTTTFHDVIERVARHVAPAGTSLVGVEAPVISDLGFRDHFPLWNDVVSDFALSLSSQKALGSGLSMRPIEDSVDDVVTWWGERTWPPNWLTPFDESRLLAAAAL